MRAPFRLLPLGALLLVSACIHRPAQVRFEQATPVVRVVLLDQKDGTLLEGLPPEVAQAIDRELERRNLVAQPLAPEAKAALAQNRSSKVRAELMAKAAGPGQLLLLVELKANFFGQFQGGYKWNVDGVVTLVSSDALAESTTVVAGVPAFLSQESEGAPEALVQAAPGIGERVAQAVDEHFAGRMSSAATPPQAATPTR